MSPLSTFGGRPGRAGILHLGGNPERIRTTIAWARMMPSALIVISSETRPAYVLLELTKAGISRGRVTFDFAAWDTVSNFTTTRAMLLAQGITDLYVVTDRSHMPRAFAIAEAVYAGTRVLIHPAEHVTSTWTPEPERQRQWDVIRADLWNVTDAVLGAGVLVYNPFTRWRTMRRLIRPAAREYAALGAAA